MKESKFVNGAKFEGSNCCFAFFVMLHCGENYSKSRFAPSSAGGFASVRRAAPLHRNRQGFRLFLSQNTQQAALGTANSRSGRARFYRGFEKIIFFHVFLRFFAL
jgi:hypothetical protein